jgi:hypothetical protein
MKSTTFKLRLSKKELAHWKALAKKEKTPLAAWVRQRCNARLLPKMVELNAAVEKLRRLLGR